MKRRKLSFEDHELRALQATLAMAEGLLVIEKTGELPNRDAILALRQLVSHCHDDLTAMHAILTKASPRSRETRKMWGRFSASLATFSTITADYRRVGVLPRPRPKRRRQKT